MDRVDARQSNASVFRTMLDILSGVVLVLTLTVGVYLIFLALLTIPALQAQVIYLNKVKLTWGQDVNVPEQWGFLPKQVTPFHLHTPDGETLHAWHILPLELYRRHEAALLAEPAGLVADMSTRTSFKLLRDDPDALLVLYLHGAAGTLASGFRPPSYRAISAGAPHRIHVVAVDYRGFGSSTGTPSEEGLLTDALALVDWATGQAGISPERIVLFSQSLGTAVTAALVQHLAARDVNPVFFKGAVMVAPFEDVATLTATYKVGGTLPILSPLAQVPVMMDFFHKFIRTHWPTKKALADFVSICERATATNARYHITIIHAQDDYDIPWAHGENVYWASFNASIPIGTTARELEAIKGKARTDLGTGGWILNRETEKGTLRQEITTYGLHDRIMGYPIISLAILRAFESAL